MRCGGVEVVPGSLVVADEDGVLIFDAEQARTLLVEFEAEAEGDEEYRRDLMRGRLPSELTPIEDLIKGKVNAGS